MTHASTQAIKDELIKDFNVVVAETEQLLKSVASAGSDQASELKTSVERSLAAAKARLCELQNAVADKAGAAVQATDEYVHVNPWQAIGVAAGIGAVIGAMIGLSLNRR